MHYEINNTHICTHTHTHTMVMMIELVTRKSKNELEYYQNSGYLYLNSYTHMNNIQ